MYNPWPSSNSTRARRAHLLSLLSHAPPQPDFIVTLDQHGRVVSSRQVQAQQPSFQQPQLNYQQPRRRRGVPQLFTLTRDPERDFMDMARESLRDMDERIAALRNENERVPSPMSLWREMTSEERYPSPQAETPEERSPTPLPARRSVTPEEQSSPSSSSSRPGTRPPPPQFSRSPSRSPSRRGPPRQFPQSLSPSPSPSPPRTRHAAVEESASASASPEEASPTPTPQSSEQEDGISDASADLPGDFASQKQAIRVELLRLSLDLATMEGTVTDLRAKLYGVLDKVDELSV
jgi:hypothetical protein